MSEVLGTKTFSSNLVREGSWGVKDIGHAESTMTLYSTDEPGHAFIEWDVPDLDEYAEIGLDFDVSKRLLDYDGVCSLPREAIELIRSCGFIVPREFEL